MNIDFNSETWQAVEAWARVARSRTMEDLINCPLDQVERCRGVIDAMDELLALPRHHGTPVVGSADIY